MSNAELAKALTGVAETLKQLRDMQVQANYIFQRMEAHLEAKDGFIPISTAARMAGSTAQTAAGHAKFFRDRNIEPDKSGRLNGFHAYRWPEVIAKIREQDRKDRPILTAV